MQPKARLAQHSVFDGSDPGPLTFTLLPTYRCSAACEQCCFGSNPRVLERLSLGEMCELVDAAVRDFNNLQLLVVSGGECFLLGDDLFAVIAHAKQHGLRVRTVTNGFWGKGLKAAERIAVRAAQAGLTEFNFSTGRDHTKFVPVQPIINATVAAGSAGVPTLVTGEPDADDRSILDQIQGDDRLLSLMRQSRLLQVRVNSWMKFTQAHVPRNRGAVRASVDVPCDQLFSNVVVTPSGDVASCCGLTFEYIPELKLGNVKSHALKDLFALQADDFLKIWVHMDGPVSIVRKVAPERLPEFADCEHICQACAKMYRDPGIRTSIRNGYADHVADVVNRYRFDRRMIRMSSTFN